MAEEGSPTHGFPRRATIQRRSPDGFQRGSFPHGVENWSSYHPSYCFSYTRCHAVQLIISCTNWFWQASCTCSRGHRHDRKVRSRNGSTGPSSLFEDFTIRAASPRKDSFSRRLGSYPSHANRRKDGCIIMIINNFLRTRDRWLILFLLNAVILSLANYHPHLKHKKIVLCCKVCLLGYYYVVYFV